MFLFLQIYDAIKFYFHWQPEVRIPLFRLPQVAQYEILSQMEHIELINFSRLSAKCLKIVKKRKFWKKLQITIGIVQDSMSFTLRFGENYRNDFYVVPEKYMPRFPNDFQTFGNKIIEVKRQKSTLETYWKDHKLGIETIGDYLFQFFEKPKISFYICSEPLPVIMTVSDWLISRKLTKLEYFVAEKKSATSNQLRYILNNFQISKSLSLRETLDYYKIRLPVNLQALNCESNLNLVHLNLINPQIFISSSFSSENINQFLKIWKQGEAFSRLKYVRWGPNVRREGVLKDIEGVEMPDDLVRNYRLEKEPYKVRGGFDITSKTGIVATIRINDYFSMTVWPDFNEPITR